MKKNELIELKKMIELELNKRKRINELLNNDLVKEYLKLTNIEGLKNNINELEILKEILKTFKTTKTNGIYVCTTSTCIEYDISYEETSVYNRKVDIDSKDADNKIYTDIESCKKIIAKKETNEYITTSIKDFENNNIVLNPYNKNENSNGYEEVRLEFFDNCMKYGQIKSKNLILKKYKRL